MKSLAWLMAAAVLVAGGVRAEDTAKPDTITTAEAAQHIGETKTVCGLVADARFIEKSGKKPTFLNFDKPFPNHTFTVVIMGEHRAKFTEAPEKTYKGKTVCVTGKITENRKKPEIAVTDPSQITVKDAAPAAAEAPAAPAAPAPAADK